MNRIKSTKKQREELLRCHPGVGFMMYKLGEDQVVEIEFYIDRKTKQLRYVSNGELVEYNDITVDY